ncbi:hypothetical protein EVAR_90948_1 [Eumeta japonica]|uniref:Uncharacterized protein n=1 Tax=Eumeta variegata TaxID=151549 RepID=A0A4C1SK65_EUMVA|nr:hypothetical protein EVAR_90948_1 [Eumeta japonica]
MVEHSLNKSCRNGQRFVHLPRGTTKGRVGVKIILIQLKGIVHGSACATFSGHLLITRQLLTRVHLEHARFERLQDAKDLSIEK